MSQWCSVSILLDAWTTPAYAMIVQVSIVPVDNACPEHQRCCEFAGLRITSPQQNLRMKQRRRERTFARQPGYPQIASSGPGMSSVGPVSAPIPTPHCAAVLLRQSHTAARDPYSHFRDSQSIYLIQSQRRPGKYQEVRHRALLELGSSILALWPAAGSAVCTDLA